MASKVREDSDYDEKYEPSSEATVLQIDIAKELIKLVEKYLNDLQSKQYSKYFLSKVDGTYIQRIK